jgi:nickel-dependent lactate racemase
MSEILLPYGSDWVNLDAGGCKLILPSSPPSLENIHEAVAFACDHPIDSPPLEELTKDADKILLAFPDYTRKTPLPEVLPALISRIPEAKKRLTLINSAGSHRPMTDDELRLALGEEIISQVLSVVNHDSRDANQLVYLGETTRKTPVLVNKLAVESDLIILVGNVTHHYFAGLGGGAKGILPGISGYEAVRKNHSLEFIFNGKNAKLNPLARAGNTLGNPVFEDMREAVSFIKTPIFIVNMIPALDGRPAKVFAGALLSAHDQAIPVAKRASEISCPIAQKFVLASAGGAPYDHNMVQMNKGLTFSAPAVASGGRLVFLSKCPEGYGSKGLEQSLTGFSTPGKLSAPGELSAPEELLAEMAKNYEIALGTAYSILSATAGKEVFIYTDMTEEMVHTCGAKKVRNLEELCRLVKTSPPGYVLPYANKTVFVHDASN